MRITGLKLKFHMGDAFFWEIVRKLVRAQETELSQEAAEVTRGQNWVQVFLAKEQHQE